jgi:peptide/nickel transport system permease protein
MGAYIARRLAWMVALLFLVSAVTFLIFYVLPSADPAEQRAGRLAKPDQVERIRERLGLDDPVHQQYGRYMDDLVTEFDLGYSFQYDASVRELMFDRVPATFSLVAGAVLLWLAIGIPVGIVSAVKRRSLADRLSMGVALVLISAPVYWLGLVSLYLFSDTIGRWRLLPGSGSYEALSDDPVAWAGSLVLPWIVLAASFAAIYARLLRGNLIEVMGEDYIRTARAKGLSERVVVLRHGVRSAITPVVTILGLDVGILLGGVLLTERVFNIPGVGRLAFDAIEKGDLPVIQGTVLLGAFFVILLNLVVDIAYAFLDPRVHYS